MSDTLGIAQPQRVNLAQMMAGRYFVIPDYQRHFAWKEKECLELFEDCVLTTRNRGHERFMSTITAIAPAGESVYKTYTDQGYSQLKPLLVVDGQQRLTSILILISTICQHLLRANANDHAARNAYANFVRTPLPDGQALLRVIPQSIPAHPQLMLKFLQEVVELEPSLAEPILPIIIPAQRRILKARAIFDQGIRDLQRLPAEEQVTLPDLLTCVASRLIFILNTLADVGQAGQVFEGLNNRGLGLSALENLKAFSIYAVQSFRSGEALPGGIEETASDLNDDFNDAVGEIYHNLDRVSLPDDTAGDLLSAFWPLVLTKVTDAKLAKDGGEPLGVLDRAQPVDGIRASLHIHNARQQEQQADFLKTLRFMICDKLVPASNYFADARRPMHSDSFQEIQLPQTNKQELRDLHQRLVEMQCSVPFLPIMLAYRTMRPTRADDYLRLVRLIERVAFWVYELGERNKGARQRELATLAREFADGKKNFGQVLLALRAFAFSKGKSTDPDLHDDDEDDLATRVDEQLSGDRPGVRGAFAYEWLLSRGVELPMYGKFLRRVREDRFVRMVPGGRGNLPQGYNLQRDTMNHPGNIIITRKMPEWNAGERKDFNALPYGQKRVELRTMGYSLPLPNTDLTARWAENQRNAIRNLVISRWEIPDDGRIAEPTWSAGMRQDVEDSNEEDEDS